MPTATPTTAPSTSTLAMPTTLSSYNNTMLSYTRAQFQQFRDTASTTAPELGKAKDGSSTVGTTSSSGSIPGKGNEGPKSPITAHDFASGRKG
ncbi:hypothetical protein VC83_08990 [Pseudogymnoascus destructans]|uniref:Uncharacterized protein n=2 Tax=Pseudogymnoascus destructans TaxID=655981 RepID=L8G6E7_PSED2|nr:uncharacterized protein VC83_08990 [Pseudogymnoascus destructans]ELR07541.1 hypothetical protein GMDG_08456 [Pseudogymnoascus destructans 20631-21]OAF54689.2 hypothetical protein VC83_08990 [Pseudogymnoascus destructans]